MQNYPLSYSVSPLLSADRVQVWDAARKAVLFVPAVDDAMKKGEKPYPVYRDKEKRTLVWQILASKMSAGENKDEERSVFTISSAEGDLLGRLVEIETGWEVQNFGGGAVAQIKEKGAEKSCLGCLFSLLDIFGVLFFFIAPHRYELEINGQAVLKLVQADYNMEDSYKLKNTGEFLESHEPLLLLGLACVLLD